MQISKAKLDGWADLPVLEYDKLGEEEKENLKVVLTPPDEYKNTILAYDELYNHKQPELKADLVTLIEDIWRDVVLFEKQ